jgi:hypothetical protein
MTSDAAIAFLSEPGEAPLEVRINFGIFAGRHATPAEIDALGRALLPLVDQVTIVAEERHEITQDSEVAVSSVRVELPEGMSVADGEALVGRCERWAQSCIAERHAEVSEL